VEGRRIAFWRAPISERRSENLSRTKCRGLSDHGSEQASEGTYARDGQLWRELSLVVMGMKQLHNTSLALRLARKGRSPGYAVVWRPQPPAHRLGTSHAPEEV
jgi:hypothetical protein